MRLPDPTIPKRLWLPFRLVPVPNFKQVDGTREEEDTQGYWEVFAQIVKSSERLGGKAEGEFGFDRDERGHVCAHLLLYLARKAVEEG